MLRTVNRKLSTSAPSRTRSSNASRSPRACSIFSTGKAAALACLMALTPPAALAMGLGDPVTASRLGDGLNLQIPLTEANGWREDQISVSLSSEAIHIIRDLTVTLQPAPGGYQIVVRSNVPLREPYLPLTVAVRWPAGNLQRDYDILIDPPSSP